MSNFSDSPPSQQEKPKNETEINEIQASLFSQISQISEFLAENADEARSDPCFNMLSSFFDIFNQQLKINFHLRNTLNLERQNNPINPKQIDKQKLEIDKFLQEFNKISNTNFRNLSLVVPFLQKSVKKLKLLAKASQEIKDLSHEIKSLQNRIEESENSIKKAGEIRENELKTLEVNINDSKARIKIYQDKIDEISPTVNKLRSYLDKEAKARNSLTTVIEERKKQIDETRAKFASEYEIQKRKKDKLSVQLSKVKAERKKLLIEEQPLISALEEAENELQTVQRLASAEIDSIAQQKNDFEIQIKQLAEQLSITQQKKESLIEQLEQRKKEFNEYSAKSREIKENIHIIRSKINRVESAKRSLLKTKQKNSQQEGPDKQEHSQQIEEQQIAALSNTISQLQASVEEKKNRIEEMRKENSLMKSKIRVNLEKISQLVEDNQRLTVTIEASEKEYELMKTETLTQKQRYDLYQSTMKEFNRLKQGLGLHASLSPIEVAKQTLSIVRSWKKFDTDDLVPEKVSINTINHDFDEIFEQINQVHAKLVQ